MNIELPNKWINVSVEELFNLSYGKGLRTKEFTEDGYDVYGANGIIGKYLEFNQEKPKVIIACRGTVGNIHLTKPKSFVTSNSIIFSDLVYGKLNQKFVFYAMKSIDKKNTITGTAIPQITIKLLKDLKFPLAPRQEQNRIVTKLDGLFAHLEEVKTRLEKVPLLLKAFRQAVLSKAVSGDLTLSYKKLNNLSNWEKISLGSISTLVTSGARGWAKYYSEEGAIFVRAQNINKDYLDLNNVAFVKLEGNTEGIRTRIFENDLLVTITGANVAKTALVDFPISKAYVSQHVSLVRLENPEFSKFVYLYLISESDGRKQLNDFAYGQGKPQLNLSNIKNVEIQLPSINEQIEIVRRVEVLFSKADQIQQRYEALNKSVGTLPKAILQKAFKGELVEQLSTDGDARELLEEIKKLKEEMSKKDKKKK